MENDQPSYLLIPATQIPLPASHAPATHNYSTAGAQNPARAGLFFICACVFLCYLTVGISLGILPAYVHQTLHYSNLVVGLVIGIQSAATLAYRHRSGRICDTKGSRVALTSGILYSVLGGVLYIIAALLSGTLPANSLAYASGHESVALIVLLLGRILLGLGESLLITGALAWGVGLAGRQRTGKVMAWVGIAMYGSLACGAPLGILLVDKAGLLWAFATVIIFPFAGWSFVLSLKNVIPTGQARTPFYKIVGLVGRPGLALALATTAFSCLASFVTLYFHQEHWRGAPWALTVFGSTFVLVRLLFAHLPDKLGGRPVALVSLCIEAAGQLLIWTAGSPASALIGACLTGMGFSLVFPAFGVEAVKKVPAENKGIALGAYVAFFDLALGTTAPIAGWIAGRFSYTAVYGFSTMAVLLSGCLALSLKKQTDKEEKNYQNGSPR